jgi:hypothetical protein
MWLGFCPSLAYLTAKSLTSVVNAGGSKPKFGCL